MKAHKKKLPHFRNASEEFDFWSAHDSVDYLEDTEEVSKVLELKKTKPAKQRITMLLDSRLKTKLQKIAAEKGIPYQTLIQMWLREKVNQEIKRKVAS